jgi:Ca-activated chloride channel homolog
MESRIMSRETAESNNIPLIDLPDGQRQELGALTVTRATGRVALPLARLEIAARVADRIAGITMTQVFRNPYQEHLEAIYTFPLSGGSAVSDFELKVGERTIRGKVEERGEARRQYQQALDEGKRAALLEQERDDVFTVQVGNLPPGEEITVKIVYSERLPFFEDGTTELRLPLIVAPRYIPGSSLGIDGVGDGIAEDTDIVPDASRISPPRLAPGFDPKVGLGIEVEILREGVAKLSGEIQNLCCSQHATRATAGTSSVKISLARHDELLNRDFVLRWQLAQENLRPSLLIYRDENKTAYGMLSIIPPRRDLFLGVARDVVFVLDRSGSMQGVKMASAARACSILLATLGPRDRFAIQAFDDRTEWFMPNGTAGNRDFFLAADEAGIERGEKFLRGIESRGGTELDRALGDAITVIGSRKEKTGRVPVIVLLTDGQVGDESRVLKRIQQEIGDTRVFTVGIDTAVNDGFLRRLAVLGGGTSTFVEPGNQLEEALCAVGREIGSPLVVDVRVKDKDAGVDLSSVAPNRIPDLFAGRATTAFFQLKKTGSVRVSGKFADAKEFEETVEGWEADLPAIAHLWARARVTDLEDRFRLESAAQADIRKQIVELAVKHNLLTRFTAFVVVDESEVVNKDGTRKKIVQPVEMPAQWEMDMHTLSAPQMPMPASQSLTQSGAIIGSPIDYNEMKAECQMPESRAKKSAMPTSKAIVHPPSPQMIPVESVQEGQGLLSRAIDKIGDMLNKQRTVRGKEQFIKDSEVSKADNDASSKVEREAVEKALQIFAKAIADARAEVEAGRVPSSDQIEKARTELVKVLAGLNLGIELPGLQRFLRTEAVELVVALNTKCITAVVLKPFFEKHGKTFEQVRAEVSSILSGKGGSRRSGSFWESSV